MSSRTSEFIFLLFIKLATNPTPKLKVMVVKALNDATGLLYLI